MGFSQGRKLPWDVSDPRGPSKVSRSLSSALGCCFAGFQTSSSLHAGKPKPAAGITHQALQASQSPWGGRMLLLTAQDPRACSHLCWALCWERGTAQGFRTPPSSPAPHRTPAGEGAAMQSLPSGGASWQQGFWARGRTPGWPGAAGTCRVSPAGELLGTRRAARPRPPPAAPAGRWSHSPEKTRWRERERAGVRLDR